MHVITAPNRPRNTICNESIFLAGSIDMGNAIDWQTQLQSQLKNLDVTVFNPRRSDWDPSWVQCITDANFNAQVNWELDHLIAASLIVFYFAPGSQAPITLMELGLTAASGKCIVCCPQGYWRRGNVQILCARYNIPMVDSLKELASAIRAKTATFNTQNDVAI